MEQQFNRNGLRCLILVCLSSIILMTCMSCGVNAASSALPKYRVEMFKQVLNHFDYTDTRTFNHKYLVIDQYQESLNSPVLVFAGNEGEIEAFYSASGFVYEVAEKYKALVLFLELRYYGDSLPFGADSLVGDNIKYLSTEQALADYAAIVKSLFGSGSERKRPVIVFGGSYGGVLSFGLRAKYPSVFDGAISSSPILMLYNGLGDPRKYNQIITQVYHNSTYENSGKSCEVIVRNGFDRIMNMIENNQLSALSQVTKTCATLPDKKTAMGLVKFIRTLLTGLVQTNYPYPVTTFTSLPANPVKESCKLMANNLKQTQDDLQAMLQGAYLFVNSTGTIPCLNMDEIPYESESMGNVPWDYLYCTDQPFVSGTYHDTDMFPADEWKMEKYKSYCNKIFPNITLDSRPNWASVYFGGNENAQSLSNIFFSQGRIDPWSAGAFDELYVAKYFPSSVRQEYIEQAAHHLDLKSSHVNDPESVRTVRKMEMDEVGKWINQFNQRVNKKQSKKVEFVPCALIYHGYVNPNASLPMAECTFVQVSLDPMKDETNNDNPLINLFVKRYRATPGQDADRALWMVPGGPGLSSDGMDDHLPMVIQATQGRYDIYVTEHRGVGRSTRLGCTLSQAEAPSSDGSFQITDNEWPDCAKGFKLEWGDNTKYFSSEAGGADLAKLIRKVSVEGLGKEQQVYVFGVSYGTAWISRLLRYCELFDTYLSEKVIKAVILDGVVATKNSNGNDRLLFSLWDNVIESVSDRLLQYCNDPQIVAKYDGLCNSKLPNAVQEARKVMDSVYANPSSCPEVAAVMPRDVMAAVLNDLLLDTYPRILIPAAIYRMKRCDKIKDIPVLSNLKKYYEMIQIRINSPSEVPLKSDVLFNHIGFSEFWDHSLTKEEILSKKKYILRSNTLKWYNTLKSTNWPTYIPNPYFYNQTFTTNSVQVLLLNGDLDPQTPLWSAQSQNNQIGGSTHRLIPIPFAVHGTLAKSPVTNGGPDCAMQMFISLLSMNVPDVNKIDTSCLSHLAFDFKGQKMVNLEVFGVEDIYEGVLENKVPKPFITTDADMVGMVVGVSLGTFLFGILLTLGVVWVAFVILKKMNTKKLNNSSMKEELMDRR